MTTLAPPPGRSRLEGLLRRGIVPLLLSVAGGLLAGFAFNQVLDRAIAGRTEASAFALLARVGPDLEAVPASGQDTREAIRRLGRQLSLRATLIAADGRVLGDSSVDPEPHRLSGESREPAGGPRGGPERARGQDAFLLDRRRPARLRSGTPPRWPGPAPRVPGEGPRPVGGSLPETDARPFHSRRPARGRAPHPCALPPRRRAGPRPPGRRRRRRGERPANPGPVSEETAVVFSALGDLADHAAERAAEARRAAGVSRRVFDEVPVGLLVVDPAPLAPRRQPRGDPPPRRRARPLPPGEHVLELVREKARGRPARGGPREGPGIAAGSRSPRNGRPHPRGDGRPGGPGRQTGPARGGRDPPGDAVSASARSLSGSCGASRARG